MTIVDAEATASAAPAPVGAPPRRFEFLDSIRALAAWYTKGFEHGSQLRVAVNGCESLAGLRETIAAFFFEGEVPRATTGPVAAQMP